MSDIDLLPCPFCGGAPLRCSNTTHFPMHWVLCSVCNASPGDRRSPVEAAVAWNRRAASAAVAKGSGDPAAWMYDGPDGQHYIREHRDLAPQQLVREGWAEVPLYADPDLRQQLMVRRRRIEPTDAVPLGLYRIHWKTGGSSLAAVGMDHSGARWMAASNWTCAEIKSPAAPLVGHPWAEVEYLEPLSAEAARGAGAR
jgi:Lar family restriction alleviation protein